MKKTALCEKANGFRFFGRFVLYKLSFVFFFIGACTPQIKLQAELNEGVAMETVKAAEAVPELDVSSADCFTPYEKDSVWNTPIDWTVAKIHPNSEEMMEAFWEGAQWIGSDPSQYAPNIYLVDNTTPLVQVKLNYKFRDAFNDVEIIFGEPGSTVSIPIPDNAKPAPGTDGQLAIVNIDTGEEWGINEGWRDALGNWHASGAYRYSINNSGVPPTGFGQRGAGIGQLAGIVRSCEVDRGYIGHAVTIAYDYPCEPTICSANGWPAVIPPFTKTDGNGMSEYDIPEGARIAIRPEITIGDVDQACSGMKGCIAWVRAMQKYGGFVVDNSGHPKTYPEGNATAQWDLDVWSRDMLRDIPQEWYYVLDWNMDYSGDMD